MLQCVPLRNNKPLEGQACVCSVCPCSLSAGQRAWLMNAVAWNMPCQQQGAWCGKGDVTVFAPLPRAFRAYPSVSVSCTCRRAVPTTAVVHPFWLCWYFLSRRRDENTPRGDHNDVPVDWVQAIKLPSCDVSNVIMVQFQQSREIEGEKWHNYQWMCSQTFKRCWRKTCL